MVAASQPPEAGNVFREGVDSCYVIKSFELTGCTWTSRRRGLCTLLDCTLLEYIHCRKIIRDRDSRSRQRNKRSQSCALTHDSLIFPEPQAHLTMVPTPRKPKSLDAESQLSPVDRTPRAKAKKIESYQENEESESDLEYPVKKKPRSSKKGAQLKVGKPGKRRRLSLAMLFELLPLELVFEIWSYLEPLDLLRISRSNKWLQDLLTSKTSVAVWRTARANVTPPLDCPPDQTEVQWASLVFENNCSLCGAPSTTTVYWALRIRACGSCRIAHLTSARAAQKRLSHVQDVETVLELVPKSRDFGARSYVAGQRYVYDTRAIEAVGEQLEGLELRIEAKLAHSHEELEAYKSAQKQIVAEITYHGQKAKEWERLWLESRREQREEIASQRKTDVQKRLLELGHDPKDVSRALSCPSVDKPKPLTENGWRAIRGTVENLVNQHKTTRLEYERRETLRRRQTKFSSVYFQFRQRTGLPPVGFAPGISDLCQLLEISSILEQENDVEVTEESFAPVLSLLPQYLDQWTRKKQELLLLKMAEAGIGGISEPPTDSNCQLLRKASSVFFCDRVKSSRRYVRRVPDDRDMAPIPPDDSMYWHLCITKESGYGRFIHRDEPDWSLSCLIFDKDVMERIDALVETLGLDPCETTASDLDALNARVICIDCDILKNDTAWSWRAAARHIRDHKSSGITWNGWRRLSQVEERAVIRLESSELYGGDLPRMICSWCRDHPINYLHIRNLAKHMRANHNKALEEADFRPDPTVHPPPIPLEAITEISETSN